MSISKKGKDSGIVFVLNNERIPVCIQNVSSSNRNTVLSCGKETICLVEHFLAACSLNGVDNIEVTTNTNELIFDDGSAMHWHKALISGGFDGEVAEKYELKEPIFIKKDDKVVIAIPHNGFEVSYYMDWDHPGLGKLWASWKKEYGIEKLLRARSFATKLENDFFGVSDRLLTLEEKGFNKKLHEPLEPGYHKILDVIGDLRLCGVNPLEINMHVIGFKSGHALNAELAREIRSTFPL